VTFKTQRYAKIESAYANVCLEANPLSDTNHHSHRQYTQLIIIIPVAFTLASFVGIAVTSAGITLYGQVIWDPPERIDHWDNFAAAFFTFFAFTLGTLGTNISANSLSAGNDMTVLWPRYINIRRGQPAGQVICAFLGGWALCPREIPARCVRLRRKL
jgi:NCS1 family nucleobase:cation symporter-1